MILRGHILDEIKKVSDESVHLCVTSPPYYGLRNYSTIPQIWANGLPLCDVHEWGKVPPRRTRHSGDVVNMESKQATSVGTLHDLKETDICRTCHAWKGELGSEPTPELYVKHIVSVHREIKRVLRDDAVLFLNLGDSYAGSWGAMSHDLEGKAKRTGTNERPPQSRNLGAIKPMDMIGIPWMVAVALREDGWYLRSDNIWFKRNPMPASIDGWRWERHRVKVGNKGRGKEGWRKETGQSDHSPDGGFQQDAIWKDCEGCDKCNKNDGLILRKGSWRTTTAHEYIFMLTKTDSYFCDREAVKERAITPEDSKAGHTFGGVKNDTAYKAKSNQPGKKWDWESSRNLRDVWDITTKPYPESHFAVFPPEIPETAIRAATSDRGCCSKCGSQVARVIEKKQTPRNELDKDDPRYRPNRYIENKYADELRDGYECGMYLDTTTVGWKATCDCKAEFIPCTVLDPFGGSGTTGEVAKRMGRNFILIELKDEYIDKLIEPRLADINPLFAK